LASTGTATRRSPSSATTRAGGYPDCRAAPGSVRWASGLPAPAHIDGTRDNHTLVVTFARLHGAELVADGLIAAGELASLVAELKAHLADPATITLYCLSCSRELEEAGHQGGLQSRVNPKVRRYRRSP